MRSHAVLIYMSVQKIPRQIVHYTLKRIIVVFTLLFLLLPHTVYANGAGLPPFFTINGNLSKTNPLQLYGITAQSFLIPQDFAPQNYLVNQPIDFAIDTTQLQMVIPENALQNTTFTWDYGDGGTAQGMKNTHTYTKMGSYILMITINVYTDPSEQPTQFIDSFLLQILPDKNYRKLPQASIHVNGEQVKDPLKHTLALNFTHDIAFNASTSKVPSGVAEYLWNFGDGQTSNRPNVTHKYNQQYLRTVVLRVKDKNGFISDAFVGLENGSDSTHNTKTSVNVSLQQQINKLIILLVFLMLALLSLIIFFIRISKRSYQSTKK